MSIIRLDVMMKAWEVGDQNNNVYVKVNYPLQR